MALARYEREKEITVGKGDCAFNAFTLALCTASILNHIERSIPVNEDINKRFELFIYNAAEVLDVASNWLAVKAELLRLRDVDKVELQHKIAPILRALSVAVARTSPNADFLKSETAQSFLTVYGNYWRQQRGLEVEGFDDDLYMTHDFIVAKFYEIYHGDEQDFFMQEKAVDNWWWNEGYDQFLDAMSQPGVWAGDLELARLAQYFNVVLDIIPEPGFLYTVYGSYGYFPYLDDTVAKNIPRDVRAEIVELMKKRFILEWGREGVHQAGINFELTSILDIQKRLQKVPQHEKVLNHILQTPNLKHSDVPADWSPSCRAELIKRNVIGRKLKSTGHWFTMNGDEALSSIDEVPHAAEVLKICRQYFVSLPTLVLHKTSDHWSNTTKILSPEELAQQAQMKEQVNKLVAMGLFKPENALSYTAAGAALRLSGNSVVAKKN